MKDQTYLYKRFYKTLPALLFIFAFYTAVMPETSFGKTFRISNIGIFNQDGFDKKFREGRDLIDKEDWARAAEKFAEITEKYPKNKSTDAALYWLAFCYKKQQKWKEVKATVERLIKDFPDSSWVGDAKVLLLEIPYQNPAISATTTSANKSLTSYAESVENYAQSLDEYTKTMTAELPLDGIPFEREDEIKFAAFQSLLAVDTKKAIELAGEVLLKDSKASETLKRQVVRAFRRSRFVKTQTAGTNFEYVRATTNIGKEFMPLLREALKKGFQNEANDKVRTEIIYALADIDDAESIEYLVQMYNSTGDKEIKKTIIYSFGSSNLSLSGTFNGTKITAVPSNTDTGKNVLFEKLLEIVRTERDPDLRRSAFSTLQRFIRRSTEDGIIETVSRIYDSETDERFRISIINYFSNLKNTKATAKLMDIAKNDKNDALRFLAIYTLRSNKDPEVVIFLESLLR